KYRRFRQLGFNSFYLNNQSYFWNLTYLINLNYCMHLTSTYSRNLYQEIAHLDQIVFEAYNNCNLYVFKTFFAEDLEFYHDKSGLISSREKMLNALETAVFGNRECKTRRELIKDSLEVYPL